MDLSIIKIGNSKGIRLSKTILEKYNIKDAVELILEKGHIVIRPKKDPRSGWEKSFQRMHEAGDDNLEFDDSLDDELLEAWQ